MPGSSFPQIEINKMHISQSIEVRGRSGANGAPWHKAAGCETSHVFILQAPLTATDTAILSGNLSTQNGNGGGSINFALRRVTSAKGWGEVRARDDTYFCIQPVSGCLG